MTDGDEPSAHTVYYINDGMNIYFESDHDSKKLHILRTNPKISLTIDEDYDDWRHIKGIQLYGRVQILPESHNTKLNEAFLSKYPHIDEFGGIPPHHLFVKIIPEKVYWMDFTKKFGHRTVYYADGEGSKKLNW
jgi:nitroimidazol reductase NimA-like FMN-containing flavoprotein (pyridoxamine 5'-phosphate oxidase superfamily)